MSPTVRAPTLLVDGLTVEYPVRHGTVRAVSDVSFEVARGQTLGLVGESGCGKSTTGKAIVQIVRPTAGRVVFDGVDLCGLSGTELRRARTGIQIIFQDPISSLNPMHTVRDIVAEPLHVWSRGTKAQRADIVAATLEAVGLDPAAAMDRRPHQFSGGQCQRISIARALVLEPKVLICDEPVSALDVSVQAQICNLLEDMKARFDLTIVFIAHDLAVVRNVSDRVAVMYLGKLCEVGRPEVLYSSPAHHYTDALLKSVPVPDPGVAPLRSGLVTGEPPSPLDPPSGCRFRTRCPRAESICAIEEPALRSIGDGHSVACHFPLVSDESSTQDLTYAR
ncbi:ABC transporter ATP-binding protein [Desertimonas flava]|uniref:ABC transporter ATP-binding protein n=1 Tax=Desertimonas flava TaxID=2064846 RepID=UPI000E3441A3|nr:oligopeptide/dipeptide ABC transporter ATP-binding protein [Desertimonas flava]